MRGQLEAKRTVPSIAGVRSVPWRALRNWGAILSIPRWCMGDSELVLGEFLRDRRSRWIVATKYSYQPAGITATLEQHLSRMGTDVVDFYQLHALPEDHRVYDELYALKKAGKVRFVGVSLYSANDIDYLIDHSMIDGVQLRFSLLDPDPFLRRVDRLRTSGLAVLIRSSLKEGFLREVRRDATFPSVMTSAMHGVRLRSQEQSMRSSGSAS